MQTPRGSRGCGSVRATGERMSFIAGVTKHGTADCYEMKSDQDS
jgi:hypothetical protein